VNKKAFLNSIILRLGIISFFGDISSEMLYPINPIFITSILGASMTSLGLIEGVATAVASILKIYAGAWSDRIRKRKVFVVVGYLFAAVAKPLTGIATQWSEVLFARSFDRFGKGLRTAPRDAMLSESVTAEERGHAFGIHRGMDTAGATLGPLIAIAYLAYYHGPLRMIYFLAFIPGLISMGLAMTISEPKPTTEIPKMTPWTWKGLSPAFKNYLLGWTLFSLTNSSDVFLLMKARQGGASVTITILLYCFYNLFYAVLSPYFGKWSDKIPRKKIMVFGLLLFALVYLGFSFATELWQYWALFAVYGVYMAATDGVGTALAVDLFDPHRKATAVGILGMTSGIATIIASTCAGLIWDHFGSTWTFVYGASGAILAMVVLSGVKINHHAK